MQQVKTRDEIEQKYKWRSEAVYSSVSEWESDFENATIQIEYIKMFSGMLTSAEAIAEALDKRCSISRVTEKLYFYAKMNSDVDGADTFFQGLTDRITTLSVQFSEASSYIEPELLSLDEYDLRAIIDSPELKQYSFYLHDLLRQREHILNESEERILAMTGDIANTPDRVFSVLDNTDMRFPSIKTEEYDEIELTTSSYSLIMQTCAQTARKQAYEKFYDTYAAFKNTYAAMYSQSVKGDIFYATVRKYPSALEAALSDNNVPTSVYDTLISAVNDKLPALHRYMRVKARMLGQDKLNMYDVYTPLGTDDFRFSYEQAFELVKKGLEPLGGEYQSLLECAFSEGWIDVFENRGKRSGAYSWGTYDTHPYVLLNHKNTLNDVFTMAHELGHSMHSYYSDSANPYHLAQYSIFTAEVASTVNEALMSSYLTSVETDPGRRLRLLNYYLEQFRTTLYRQVMFAEFEKWTHEYAMAGQALTVDEMSAYYLELNKKYYGDAVISDDRIALEWMRIPHFYSAFYVYKYATGFASAVKLADDIKNGDTQPYMEFLKSGGTNYPIEQLKNAGVDLTTPKPIFDALNVFSSCVYELDTLSKGGNL